MTIQAEDRKVPAVTPEPRARGKGPTMDFAAMSTRDRARAVLHAGERAGHWITIGRHEDRYLLEMAGGKVETMTDREVLDWPVIWFINSQNAEKGG